MKPMIIIAEVTVGKRDGYTLIFAVPCGERSVRRSCSSCNLGMELRMQETSDEEQPDKEEVRGSARSHFVQMILNGCII